MTDIEWQRRGPQLAADIKKFGLRTAVENFLDRRSSDVRALSEVTAARVIVDSVSRARAVPAYRMRSKARHPRVIAARWEVWFRLHVVGFSGPAIAKMWGVDPSTVCDARASFRERFPALAAEIVGAAEAARRPAVVAMERAA